MAEQSMWKLCNPALPALRYKDCKQRMSRARVWFEIKRCFDADVRRESSDWKTRYTRELLLKAIKEALQRDGFAIIDAALPARAARQLSTSMTQCSRPLCSPADLSHLVKDESQAASGWVGSHLSKAASSCDARLSDSVDRSPLGQNCEITFGDDSRGPLRPCNKAEFISMMKLFVDAIAENSTSAAQLPLPTAERVLVQVSFGDHEALENAQVRRRDVSLNDIA